MPRRKRAVLLPHTAEGSDSTFASSRGGFVGDRRQSSERVRAEPFEAVELPVSLLLGDDEE